MTKAHTPRTARRVRSALMLSTALSFGVAGQAFAQSVVETGVTTDITVNQPTATGAATAVYLQTNGGTINVTVPTVTSTATDVAGGAVVSLATTGDKAITANFGTITTTGNGDSTAVYAITQTGNININAGAIDSTGNFTAGVIANSTSGNIALTGNTLILRGPNFDADGNTGDGMVAITRDGTASITLGRGEVDGNIGSIAAAVTGVNNGLTGGNATVVVGSGKTTGNQGTAVFALVNGLGTASTTTTGTVEATGNSVSGVVGARSTGGNAVINAGTTIASGTGLVTNRPYSYAISGISKTGTVINAGTTSATGYAILGTASAGDVTITTTGNTHSETNNAVYVGTNNNTTAAVNATVNLAAGTTTSSNATGSIATVYIGNVTTDATLNSMGTVTGKGTAPAISVNAANKVLVNSNVTSATGAGAIFASGTGGTTVNAGTTTGQTYAIQAVSAIGDVVVSTTGNTHGATSNAISASTTIIPNNTAPGGNITISTAAGTTTSSGVLNSGTIGVTARGNLTLDIGGKVTGSQTAAATIGGSAGGTMGKVVANINEVSNTGTREAIGLAGAGGVELTVGKASSIASTTNVIQVGSNNGDVVIDAGSVTGSANSAMINVTANRGSITITADEILNSNTNFPNTPSNGIFAQSGGAYVEVNAGTVESQGQSIAVRNINVGGVFSNTVASINTTGDITSRTSNAISVGGNMAGFEITLAADHVVTGYGGTVVAGGSRPGTGGNGVLVNNGTIAAKGAAEGGVGMTTDGDLTITSNIVTVEGTAAPTSTFIAAGIGAHAAAGGDVTIDSNSVTVNGAKRHGISAITVADGEIIIKSVNVSSNADDFATIRATSVNGDITIDSGTLVSGGNGAPGIHATSTGGGDIAITSVNLSTTGLNAGAAASEGIYTDTSGTVTIDSGTVTIAGYGASGIAAVAGTGVTISSDTITTGGNDTTALYWNNSTSGDVNITSNSVTTTGSSASGIAGSNLGTGSTTVTSTTVSTMGLNAYGISATGAGAQTVNSVDVTAGRFGVNASSSASDATINLSGTTVAGTNYTPTTTIVGYGARAIGTVARINTSLASSTTGAEYGVILAGRDTAILANNGTIAATGLTGIGVRASGTNAVNINSNIVSSTGAQGYGINAYSAAGDILAYSTTVSSGGYAAIDAIADNGSVTIYSGTATNTNAYGNGINATGKTGVTISATTTTSTGRAIDAYSSDGDVSITVNGNTTSSVDGPGIGADGVNVAIVLGQGTVTDGYEGGIEAEARGNLTIDARGTIRGHDDDAIGIAAEVTGTASIKSNIIEITGTGEDPGLTNGFRSGQGGIVVEGGAGAISVESNSVTVAGDNRYGIYVAGTGAIDVKSGTLSYAAKDSAGIMILGGAGAVTVNSGTLTATGASGAGIAARSTSGNITLVADQTHLNATGMFGNFTADAVVALSDSGAVAITSNNASTAGLYGSAVAGVGSSVTLNSTTASVSGNQGAIIYAQALAGNTIVNSGTVTSTGTGTGAINARATGTVTVTSGTITSAAAGATGILAQGVGGNTITTGSIATDGYAVRAIATGGDNAITVNGAVASTNAYGIYSQAANATITVGAGKSVSGKGVGITGTATGQTTINNAGTISGTVAINTGGTLTINNTGTITGTTAPAIYTAGAVNLVNSGTIGSNPDYEYAVVLGALADTVTLKTGSVVNGALVGGDGVDTLILSGTGTVSSVAETMAKAYLFENVTVASGYWTAGTQSGGLYEKITIASGATLQINAVDGVATIGSDEYVNNGVFVVNATGATPLLDDGVVVGGTGSTVFIGNGTTILSDANVTHAGATRINGGTVQLASGNMTSDIVIATGATFRLGNGGTTGTITGDLTSNGTFIYDRSDSYTIAGDFTGAGSLNKNGAGVLTFGGEYGFTGTTNINGGSVKFTGQLAPTTEINLTSGTLDLSEIEGGQQTIGELAGTSSGGVELGNSELTVNQTTNTSFAGTISGDGGITKTGTGTLNLTGNSDYTGDTNVSGGTLKVNGSISESTVVMSTGGTLGGNGTIGGLSGTGGNVAPGNSIGQLTVLGNIVWNPAFVYQVEVNNVGGADRIDATGTAALGGATLQVLPEAGRYRGRTTYTILTAAGGVTGTFGTITSSFAFLTPSVTYGATTVTLALTRNNAAFASFGANTGQIGVATAIQALGANNALFEETLLLQDTQVRPAFASVTGEIYGGIASGTIENMSALRRSLTGRAKPADAGLYGWANAIGNWGDADSTTRTDHLRTSQEGVAGGIGYSTGNLDISVGYAGTKTKFRSQGEARGDTRAVTGTLGYQGDTGFWATLGGVYSWNEFDVTRRSSLGAISQGLTSKFDSKSSQVFGELGFMANSGQFAFGPFIGLSQVNVDSDAVSEAGGSTGLVIGADNRNVTFGLAGVKVKGLPGAEVGGASINPNVSIAYRRAWGDTAQVLNGRFVGTVPSFGVLGPIVAKDAAEVGLGVEARTGRFGFSIGYTGNFAKDWSNHSAQASVSVRF
ncbi:MAG: autotransporter-associated beta strand repeat-containing protein [Pseudomonadota bacterium]